MAYLVLGDTLAPICPYLQDLSGLDGFPVGHGFVLWICATYRPAIGSTPYLGTPYTTIEWVGHTILSQLPTLQP